MNCLPGPRSVTGMALDSHYEIRVLGSLDGHWAAWFEGLQVSSDGGQTVLSGLVADQAALHGVLNKVCGLGLVLISYAARPRLTTARHRHGPAPQQLEEEIMHPVILQQLAAEHLQQMLAEADDGRRPRLAFGALVRALADTITAGPFAAFSRDSTEGLTMMMTTRDTELARWRHSR